MIDQALLFSLLWIAPSFVLHDALHEGSHAAAIALQGGHVTKLSLLPHVEKGELVFAEVQALQLPDKAYPMTAIAPVIVESIWLAGATWAFFNTNNQIAKGILRTEMLAALLDIFVWGLGAWTMSPTSDASQMHWQLPGVIAGSQLVYTIPMMVGPMAMAWKVILPTIRW